MRLLSALMTLRDAAGLNQVVRFADFVRTRGCGPRFVSVAVADAV